MALTLQTIHQWIYFAYILGYTPDTTEIPPPRPTEERMACTSNRLLCNLFSGGVACNLDRCSRNRVIESVKNHNPKWLASGRIASV